MQFCPRIWFPNIEFVTLFSTKIKGIGSCPYSVKKSLPRLHSSTLLWVTILLLQKWSWPYTCSSAGKSCAWSANRYSLSSWIATYVWWFFFETISAAVCALLVRFYLPSMSQSMSALRVRSWVLGPSALMAETSAPHSSRAIKCWQ